MHMPKKSKSLPKFFPNSLLFWGEGGLKSPGPLASFTYEFGVFLAPLLYNWRSYLPAFVTERRSVLKYGGFKTSEKMAPSKLPIKWRTKGFRENGGRRISEKMADLGLPRKWRLRNFRENGRRCPHWHGGFLHRRLTTWCRLYPCTSLDQSLECVLGHAQLITTAAMEVKPAHNIDFKQFFQVFWLKNFINLAENLSRRRIFNKAQGTVTVFDKICPLASYLIIFKHLLRLSFHALILQCK